MATKTDICNLALSLIGEELSTLTDVDVDDTKVSRTCLLHYDQTLEEVTRSHTWNCAKERAKLCASEVGEIYPSSIEIAGAGTSAVNGTYTLASVGSNGYPTYTQSVGGSNILAFNESDSQWKISLISGYYLNNSCTIAPPKTGWEIYDAGSLDAPTLDYYVGFGWNMVASLPENCVRPIALTTDSSYYRYLIFKTEWIVEGRNVLSNQEDNFLLYETIPTLANMDALFMRAFYTQLAIKICIPISGDRKIRTELIQEMESLIMPEARRVNGFEGYQSPVADSEWLEATLISSTGGSTSWQALSVGDIPM